ncbi:uncharacterized protein [Palaemon carinicauda]|uniref:uncharacterized protein n=1 Tax=Palaemon carinicauda TaxID=392227 RepID=UPI0035B5856E
MLLWFKVSISLLFLFSINIDDLTASAAHLPRQGSGNNRHSSHPTSGRVIFRQGRPLASPPPRSHLPQRPPTLGPLGKQGPPFSPFRTKEEWSGPFGSLQHPPAVSQHFPNGPGHDSPPHGFRDVPAGGPHEVLKDGPGGCNTVEGFRFAGEIWYANGCRRRKCIHFRGSFFTETDACDTEIYNTTYKCIIEVDTQAQYPDCCPRYRCNPDNLGNDVK